MGLFERWNVQQRGPADAPPVLFLHGFLGRGEDWSQVLDGLDDAFRCITVDLPGHGVHALDENTTQDILREEFSALIGTLETDHVALVGYSMGGRVALWSAAQHPNCIRALVLESSQPGIRDTVARAERQRQDAALADRLETMAKAPEAFHAFLEEWYRLPLFQSVQSRPELLARMLNQRAENDPVQLARATRLIGGGALPPVWEHLPTLPFPALCVTGTEDQKYCRIAEEMRGMSPRIATQSLERCGHNVHLENPAGYTTVLRCFLEATLRPGA